MSEITSTHYTSQTPPVAQASQDIVLGLRRYELWGLQGWYDIKQRYRRSMIGPLWLTISMGVTVTALGFLYAHLFRLDLNEFLPFLAFGFIIWQFISGILNESSVVFASAEGLILQTQTPYFVHVLRLVWRNLIILGHNMVIYVFVLMIFDLGVNLNTLLFIPALLLTAVIAVGTTLFLGLVCTRYRDVGPLVQNLTQLVFFITPIIWKPEMLADRAMFLDFNPFYHVVSILRDPLLMQQPSALNWAVCCVVAVGMLALGFGAFAAARRRLPYWL